MSDSAGLIFAGGESRRFGGQDKAQLKLCGHPLIERTLFRFKRQVKPVGISVRHSTAWSDTFAVPVIEDAAVGAGPLAGLLAGLKWAACLTPQPKWLVTIPVDVPFFPDDLVTRLTTHSTDVAVAKSASRLHHTVAAWRLHVASKVRDALTSNALAVQDLQASLQTTEVVWPSDPIDPFTNINTPSDLAQAEKIAASIATGDS